MPRAGAADQPGGAEPAIKPVWGVGYQLSLPALSQSSPLPASKLPSPVPEVSEVSMRTRPVSSIGSAERPAPTLLAPVLAGWSSPLDFPGLLSPGRHDIQGQR